MLSAQRLRNAVLLLALVLGQWLTFAHAQQHPAVGHLEKACVYCVHAPGLDTGGLAPVASLTIQLPFRHETPAIARQTTARQVRATAPPIRGPPSTFV